MSTPAFEPLYSELYLSPGVVARAQSFISNLHSTLKGDYCPRVVNVLELDPIYARVKQTGNLLQ